MNPQGMNAQSIMPRYPWLAAKDIDVAITPAKIRAMQTLGVPYPEGFDLQCEAELMKQATTIANGLKSSGIDIEPQKQIIALISYLQRLGRDISESSENADAVVEPQAAKGLPMPLVTDEAALAEAKGIFSKTCFPCHGMLGEGNAIGPNLTDNYFISGGLPEDIYTVISEGVPLKGMQSWKQQFSEEQMVGLTSYVISLQGTNPPNAKDPQGDPFEN
jgi:mono/diheme cytochrome c family protein